MKTHMVKISKAFGGECRGSLCGRLNIACTDGMNVTDRAAEVTCAFCLRLIDQRTRATERPVMLVHYSDRPLGPIEAREQEAPQSFADKPRGLWVSVEGNGDGWRDWCEEEKFNRHRLAIAYGITLTPDARVLRIGDEAAFDRFHERYSVPGSRPMMDAIFWPRVARRYDGIIIAPLIESRRLDRLWYNCWDCASGCIWAPRAIAGVSQLGLQTTHP